MQEEQGWHLGKTIDLTHVLTTAGMIIALFAFVNDFDDRVDLLEYKQEQNEKAIEEEHEFVKTVFEQIRQDLNYIRKRVDEGN